MQRICHHALDGTLAGAADLLKGKSALHEMARERRLARRVLAEHMMNAIHTFPCDKKGNYRKLNFWPSSIRGTGYVFLQMNYSGDHDYDNVYRPARQKALAVACGVARSKFPELNKVVGIAMDPPRCSNVFSDDHMLLECADWTEHDEADCLEANQEYRFFEKAKLQKRRNSATDFPVVRHSRGRIGRNDQCPCGSGMKYKKCCLKSARVG